ncbi:hypothetical protein DRF62_18635 [Chryseobacterium piscium]|uniref:Transposase n=1 Tax=Chryseobacterium piscium TaxID=333702 RepID=A0A3D9BB33_9FLAO|nr:hypothetical protein [Chryseobacterium piscium]REC50811.1 hypothetical protein DRF62_18635 [Chryseobacterium piscium]
MENKKGRKMYTQADREKALKYYLLGLNLFEVSKLTEVPERTLQKWQSKESWVKLKDSEKLRKKAVDLKNFGLSNKKISEILLISSTTVWRYCKQNK